MNKMTDNKPLIILSVAEVAELLKTTPQTIRIYINQGRIKAKKIGRRWLIEEQAIRDFLRDQ